MDSTELLANTEATDKELEMECCGDMTVEVETVVIIVTIDVSMAVGDACVPVVDEVSSNVGLQRRKRCYEPVE